VAQAAGPFDHSLWDAFLKKYVNEQGDVNYQAVKKDPVLLNDYLQQLGTVTEIGMRLEDWPREEMIAFWLNAYHAALVKMVIENYPVTTVQKIPSFWDITVVKLGPPEKDNSQAQYSLNDVRVLKLIGIFRDEKIHLALSLAARGGPRLKREAFTGPKVEGQLFMISREFVNDPRFVDIVPGRKKINLSKVFKWYDRDFDLDFGVPEPIGKFSKTESAVLSFLAYYLEDNAKTEYLQEGRYKISYPAFDWALNDWSENVVSASSAPAKS